VHIISVIRVQSYGAVDRKIAAFGIAIAILLTGFAAYIYWPQEKSNGWYSWNPTVGTVDYTKITISPNIMDAVEGMYVTVYGELPSTEGVTVPEEEMIPVFPLNLGADVRGSGVKIISYSAGVTDTYVSLLGSEVWNTVVAAGNSSWRNYSNNGMEKWDHDQNGFFGSLGSENTISTSTLVRYLDHLNDHTTEYCVIMWSYTTNIDEVRSAVANAGYDNVEFAIVGDSYKAPSDPDILSTIAALGEIVGISGSENKVMYQYQTRCYVISNSLKDVEYRTVYLELADGKSPGAYTLTQYCFDFLHLKNINGTSGITKLSDSTIENAKPSYIFFTFSDARSMDVKMRAV
jgi:hypothetical protein